MRLSQRQLRRLIEAEVDKMRLPRGPNSRDDGDKDLTEDDLVEGRLNEEIDPMFDLMSNLASDLKVAIDMIEGGLGPDVNSDVYEGLDAVSKVMTKLRRYASQKPRAWQYRDKP